MRGGSAEIFLSFFSCAQPYLSDSRQCQQLAKTIESRLSGCLDNQVGKGPSLGILGQKEEGLHLCVRGRHPALQKQSISVQPRIDRAWVQVSISRAMLRLTAQHTGRVLRRRENNRSTATASLWDKGRANAHGPEPRCSRDRAKVGDKRQQDG